MFTYFLLSATFMLSLLLYISYDTVPSRSSWRVGGEKNRKLNAFFGKYTQFYKFSHIGHSPWNQNAVLILTLACLSPSDTIATEPEQSSFPTEKTKAFNQVVCSPKALTVSMFSGCTCWHGQSHISSQHPPHLSSVDEFVDLCGGDSRNDQTYGHNGEAGQNFIPHDYSLKLSGDKEQLCWQPSCPKTTLDSLFC